MQMVELIERLNLEVAVPPDGPRHVQAGYVSDLLSDVMGNAAAGSVWVTIQCHPNIVAVAALTDLAGIILTSNTEPDPQTLEKAREHKMPILTTPANAFDLVGELYNLGLRGADRKRHAGI